MAAGHNESIYAPGPLYSTALWILYVCILLVVTTLEKTYTGAPWLAVAGVSSPLLYHPNIAAVRFCWLRFIHFTIVIVQRVQLLYSSPWQSVECTLNISPQQSVEHSAITFNSLWLGDALRWHGSGSTLAQVMACCLFDAKPLPHPMMVCCQFDL